MITLDQIKQLDLKVRKAIDKINSLTGENNMLQDKLDTYQLRIEELEILIDTFKEDQGEIEHGIIDALNQLDTLEETLTTSDDNSKQDEEPSVEIEESDNADQQIVKDKEESEPESTQESSGSQDIQEETAEESNDSEVELDIF